MECVLPWQFSVAFLSSSKLSSLSCCLEGCFCTLLLSITALFYTTHTRMLHFYLNRHCVSRVWSSVFKDLCPRFFAVAAWHSISCHFLCHPEKSLHLLLIRPSRFCCHLESDKSTHWYTFFHLIEQFFMLWAWVLCALKHREGWTCFQWISKSFLSSYVDTMMRCCVKEALTFLKIWVCVLWSRNKITFLQTHHGFNGL